MRWAWITLIAIGCSHPSAPPPATVAAPKVQAAPDAGVTTSAAPAALEDDLPRLAERAVKLYQEWQRAFAEVGTDCAAATERMNALADANADLIAANQRLMHDGHDRIKAAREELDKHSAEVDAAAQAIMQGPTMSACASNATFNKALDRLAGEG